MTGTWNHINNNKWRRCRHMSENEMCPGCCIHYTSLESWMELAFCFGSCYKPSPSGPLLQQDKPQQQTLGCKTSWKNSYSMKTELLQLRVLPAGQSLSTRQKPLGRTAPRGAGSSLQLPEVSAGGTHVCRLRARRSVPGGSRAGSDPPAAGAARAGTWGTRCRCPAGRPRTAGTGGGSLEGTRDTEHGGTAQSMAENCRRASGMELGEQIPLPETPASFPLASSSSCALPEHHSIFTFPLHPSCPIEASSFHP